MTKESSDNKEAKAPQAKSQKEESKKEEKKETEVSSKKTKSEIPEIQPGYKVKVFQKIKEGDKERVQAFEGIVIAKKGKDETTRTITVRKISEGIGVEKIFPLFSPTIEKIEIVKKYKVRRSKLYYLRKKGMKTLKKEVS